MTLRKPLLGLLLLTACAQPGPHAAPTPVAGSESKAAPTARAAIPAGITKQQLYQFLLAEIASQRGDLRLASESFMDLAKKTRDARLARRAADWSMHQPERTRTLKALRLWLELEPGATQARERLLVLLLLAKDAAGLQTEMRQWLQQGPADKVWPQLAEVLIRPHAQAELALESVTVLAREYDQLPEAALARGRVALVAERHADALQAAEVALALRPQWDSAMLLKGEALGRSDAKVGIAWLRAALETQPKATRVREALAEALRRDGDITGARAQYRHLLDMAEPKSVARAEWLVMLGMLSEKLGEDAEAEGYLQEALTAGLRNADGVRLVLGELAEKQGRLEDALKHYRSVSERHLFEAQSSAIGVLARLKRFDEARAALQRLRPRGDAERLQRIQLEAELAREAGDTAAQYAALELGLTQLPDHPELLYDHAMVAERLGRFDVAERDLRRLIALRPEHAHAYNALAYTLSDRLGRAVEAIPLLETALKLAPEDPYILDSMGWALFKAGRVEESVSYLQRAYKRMPDAEVALHLGEALWQRGEREAARAIWQAGLKQDAPNGTKAALAERLKW